MVTGERQKEHLKKLTGFTFGRHPEFNLSEERLEAVGRLLRKRVRQLIDLPPALEE